jgi:hypothetical protein
MIVASTTMPIEIARPPSDIRFAFNPVQRMMMNVRSPDSGRARITTSAPLTLQRKRARITRTRTDPSASAFSTVLVLASTTDDRS